MHFRSPSTGVGAIRRFVTRRYPLSRSNPREAERLPAKRPRFGLGWFFSPRGRERWRTQARLGHNRTHPRRPPQVTHPTSQWLLSPCPWLLPSPPSSAPPSPPSRAPASPRWRPRRLLAAAPPSRYASTPRARRDEPRPTRPTRREPSRRARRPSAAIRTPRLPRARREPRAVRRRKRGNRCHFRVQPRVRRDIPIARCTRARPAETRARGFRPRDAHRRVDDRPRA